MPSWRTAEEAERAGERVEKGEEMKELWLECTGCGRQHTFKGPTAEDVARAVIEGGWATYETLAGEKVTYCYLCDEAFSDALDAAGFAQAVAGIKAERGER